MSCCSVTLYVVLLDVSVSLDQILIQLADLAPDWRRLAQALETDRIKDIANYVCELFWNMHMFIMDVVTCTTRACS